MNSYYQEVRYDKCEFNFRSQYKTIQKNERDDLAEAVGIREAHWKQVESRPHRQT